MFLILLCQHQYELVNREETTKYEDGSYVYKFECKKCKKIKELEALDIIDVFASKKLLCLRLRIFYPIYKPPKRATYRFYPFLKGVLWYYEGGFVTRTLKHYKRRGIDLRDIERI